MSAPRMLVVTAVDAERDAVREAVGPDVDVCTVGVGPHAAAAGTSALLASGGASAVISAGIAGGFAPLGLGDIAVASAIVFADLGIETEAGTVPLDLGTYSYPVAAPLAVAVAEATGGHLGTILTVACVTGTAESAHALLGRYPDSVAEAMEGAGVAAAAAVHAVPVIEVRAISNTVGPRDRAAWDIAGALAALGPAVASALDALRAVGEGR